LLEISLNSYVHQFLLKLFVLSYFFLTVSNHCEGGSFYDWAFSLAQTR